MELQSNNKLPLVTNEGKTQLICFNEQEVTIKDGTKNITMYQYDYARTSVAASESDIISAIIRSRYSADEMEAIINNHLEPEETEVHAQQFADMQAWRAKAKEIAHQVISL